MVMCQFLAAKLCLFRSMANHQPLPDLSITCKPAADADVPLCRFTTAMELSFGKILTA